MFPQNSKTNFNTIKNVKIKYLNYLFYHDLRYALNSRKLIKSLKWKPQINISNGLNIKPIRLVFK